MSRQCHESYDGLVILSDARHPSHVWDSITTDNRHWAFIESIHHLMLSSAGSGGRVASGVMADILSGLRYRGFLLMQIRISNVTKTSGEHCTVGCEYHCTMGLEMPGWDNVVVPG